MPRQRRDQNGGDSPTLGPQPSGGHLHVTGTAALLRVLPEIHSNRERLLILLRSRPFLTHTEAIEALWSENKTGDPLYAREIVATYVSRLRRAGHSIENCRGSGYRMRTSPPLQRAAEGVDPSMEQVIANGHAVTR